MAFCQKCGAELKDGAKFCPSCGASVNAGSKTDFSGTFEKFNDTADTTDQFDAADIEQNKAMGVLAYLSWLVLIPQTEPANCGRASRGAARNFVSLKA